MHPMLRFARYSRFALPLLLAAAGAVLKLRAGSGGSELVLVIVSGALLGWTLAFSLESVTVLLTGPLLERVSDRKLQALEREKEIVLRSIKDLELDTALRKLAEEDARQLSEPLRQRAMSLLYELDRARADHAASAEEQIESELRRRLAGEGAELASKPEVRG